MSSPAVSILVSLVGALGVGRGQGLNASMLPVPITPDTAAMRALSPPQQLAAAFEAAFADGQARVGLENGAVLIYQPAALAWAMSGAVLISAGCVVDGAHMDSCVLAIHYLKPEGKKFKVGAAYPHTIEGGLWAGAGQWVVSTDFGCDPIVVADTFHWRSGVIYMTTTLYELCGHAPERLCAFTSIYDNTAAVDSGSRAVSIIGSIRNIVKGKSFEVHFEGTSQFIHVYARQAGKYVKIGSNGELLACPHG